MPPMVYGYRDGNAREQLDFNIPTHQRRRNPPLQRKLPHFQIAGGDEGMSPRTFGCGVTDPPRCGAGKQNRPAEPTVGATGRLAERRKASAVGRCGTFSTTAPAHIPPITKIKKICPSPGAAGNSTASARGPRTDRLAGSRESPGSPRRGRFEPSRLAHPRSYRR